MAQATVGSPYKTKKHQPPNHRHPPQQQRDLAWQYAMPRMAYLEVSCEAETTEMPRNIITHTTHGKGPSASRA